MKIKEDDKISTVLKYHDDKLHSLVNETKNRRLISEDQIKNTEKLLTELGYNIEVDNIPTKQNNDKKIMYVPSFEQVFAAANKELGKTYSIESLFTKEELVNNSNSL